MSIRYWISPTAICAASTREHGQRRAGRRGSGAYASQTTSTANEIPKTAVARTWSHIAGRTSRAAGSACRRSCPGSGPPAVANVPVTTSAAHDGADEQRRAAAGERQRLAADVPRLERDEHAEREDREREQEVREHEPRVEVEVDGDRAERRLRERAEERREREPARPRRHGRRPAARRATSRA